MDLSILNDVETEPTDSGAHDDQNPELDGQPEGEQSDEESKDLEPSEILNQVLEEKEDPETSKELLEKINTLGAIHNGTAIQVESQDQLKELIQKGYDYTQKTMGHSEEVKQREAEFEKRESEFKQREEEFAQKENELVETVTENRIMASVLEKLSQEDPDLLSEFQRLFNQELKSLQANQPYLNEMNQKFSELKNSISSLHKEKESQDLAKVNDSWTEGLKQLQEQRAPALAKLGVVPNWDKVEEKWRSDSSNSMTPEEALFAVHGKDIAAAYESHKKLLETRTKTQNSILKKSGASSLPSGRDNSLEVKNGNMEDFLRQQAEAM